MASTKDKGSTYLSPTGVVAVRMGPAVQAGQYFVIDPDNGGYYATDDKVAEIEKDWKFVGVAENTQPAPEPPAAPVMPTAPATPAATS